MPLLDPDVSPRLLWPRHATWPRRRARSLLKRFQACFPELVYDMDLGVGLANAQAFTANGKKHIRLYGGLVRHRKIRREALALTLAHETGHHLGGPPFMRFHRWLSDEERASDWAMTTGLKIVFGSRHATRIADRGLQQLRGIGLAL